MRPKNSIQFTLADFLAKKNECGVFINMLTDINKLIAFEQKDAYEIRNLKNENPTWKEWDFFVKPEYRRIENAADNEEDMGDLHLENDDNDE